MKTELNFFSKLHVRISLTFLLFSLSIILLLSGSIYHFTSDMLIKNDVVRTRTMVNQTGEYISSYLKKLGDFSNIIAEHKDIKSALAKSSPEALESISSLIHLAKEVDENIRFRLSDAGHMLRICNCRIMDNRRSEKQLKLYFQEI